MALCEDPKAQPKPLLLVNVAHHRYPSLMEEESGRDLALLCAEAASDIGAGNVQVLDLRGKSTLTDFIVVASGNSMPHLKAVLREVEEKAHQNFASVPNAQEGQPQSRWVILDYIDVMIHVMLEDMREVYALEDLWGDAEVIYRSEAEEVLDEN